jgi:Adenylate and Guanylate cyclase catalytic domain
MTLVIAFTICMFLLYDRLVEKRQRLVLSKAAQSTAIVSSLFPKHVRDKMMEMQEEKPTSSGMKFGTQSSKLKAFMSDNGSNIPVVESQLAELFPYCTVLFADISGFTAWSSTREPANVFVLLQTVFSGFDRIAKRRKVFKVETIGDCYVAATGLPEAQANHFVIMARFAWECRSEMHQMMRELEKKLGPDCSDLVMRFGKR